MSNKSALDCFNEMDLLWENFKSATWNSMSGQMANSCDRIQLPTTKGNN